MARAAQSGIQYSLVSVGEDWIIFAATDKGLCCVMISDNPETPEKLLQQRFPTHTCTRVSPGTNPHSDLAIQLYRNSQNNEQSSMHTTTDVQNPPLDLVGTAFQKQVWHTLTTVPPGTVVTYSELAARAGYPRAVRAVATACASNPLAWFVPCHRVVRKDGAPGGYRWGLKRKQKFLDQERKP